MKMHQEDEFKTAREISNWLTESRLDVGLAAQPRTALVTQLLELREKYIASGGKLYTADEINNEVRGV